MAVWKGFAFGAALFFIPSIASASCAQKDLVGIWRLNVVPASGAWYACELQIDRLGQLTSDSACVTAGSKVAKLTGKFIVADRCIISGKFSVKAETIELTEGSMNIDRSQVNGIGKLGPMRFFSFLAVKK